MTNDMNVFKLFLKNVFLSFFSFKVTDFLVECLDLRLIINTALPFTNLWIYSVLGLRFLSKHNLNLTLVY